MRERERAKEREREEKRTREKVGKKAIERAEVRGIKKTCDISL